MLEADFTALQACARAQPPQVAIVLGSGLGEVARDLHTEHTIGFGSIPGLCETTVDGHHGRVSLGDWAGRRVLVFEGRLHFYEGYPWDTVVAPIHLAAKLGARAVLLTNAAGGIAERVQPRSLMAIREHVELNHRNAWRCARPCREPYSERLLMTLQHAAKESEVTLHEGVYAAVTGPCYETPVEVRALRSWGADAVGMSTTREAAAALQCGLECAAISCITNTAAGLCDRPLRHDDVMAASSAVADSLGKLLTKFLTSYRPNGVAGAGTGGEA